MMEMWSVDRKLLYNPKSRVIDYVVPGIIGLILQLLTVTLMACTIARERESGTLYQLMITALRRREIVIGKMLPYLVVSQLTDCHYLLLSGWHFGVAFHDLPALALVCLLFLLCSLGLGFADLGLLAHANPGDPVFGFLFMPVFVLSGAFAPLEAITPGGSLHCRAVSAYTFLPRFSAGEHVCRESAVLC
jgi:ABC-2 type transport system permease protein